MGPSAFSSVCTDRVPFIARGTLALLLQDSALLVASVALRVNTKPPNPKP